MRLIGIALLAMLLAGVAFLLTERRAEVLAAVPMLSGTDRIAHRFDIGSAPALEQVDEDFPRIAIAAEAAGDWTALSSIPSYGTIRFHLPRDTTALAGELVLDLRSDIAEGIEGEFRINLNGKRRGVVTLRPGNALYRITLPLSAEDLIRRQLVVSMAMLGDTAHATCTTHEGFGALMEVQPSSTLRLAMEEDLTSFADRLLIAGEPAEMIWPDPETESAARDHARALSLAIAGQTLGHEVRFVPRAQASARSIDPLADDEMLELPRSRIRQLAWPVTANDAGASTSAVTFQREVDWNFHLQRSALPDRTLPTLFDLHLRTQQLGDDGAWTLFVVQDGTILHQDRFAADGQVYRATIPLGTPDETELLRYTVRLQADWQGQGPCLIRPELTAQLLPTTAFEGGRVSPETEMEPLMAVLGRTPSVGIDLWSSLDVTTANAMLGLARDLVVNATTVSVGGDSDIFLGMASVADAIEFAETDQGTAWVRGYFTPGEPAQTLPLDRGAIALLERADGPRAVMIVSLGSGS